MLRLILALLALNCGGCAHLPRPGVASTYACRLDEFSCRLLDHAAAEARTVGYQVTRDDARSELVFASSSVRFAMIGGVGVWVPGARPSTDSAADEMPVLERLGRVVFVHLKPSLGGPDGLLERAMLFELTRGRVVSR